MKFRLLSALFILLGAFAVMFAAQPAQAACTGCCNCETVRNYIITELDKHETFLTDTFYKKYLGPAIAQMANKINFAMADQTVKLGTLLEGQDNVEKRRVLQELTADTARSYLPSEQLCRFASLGQSLSSSDEKARANRLHMIDRSQSRQLGDAGTAGEQGNTRDMAARASQKAATTCDKTANGGRDAATCVSTSDTSTNADLDFTRTFDSKPTLDADFSSNGAQTEDERNVTHLADNIFASDLFQRPNIGDLTGTDAVNDARQAVMDMRSIIAKRSVAENSFNTLVSLKSRGSGLDGNKTGSTSFIAGVLKEIGLDDQATLNYLGKAPSYDAQMEVLTKKVYQSPSFYINLMDNPANIERQYAAMQSFGLMQQRDIFDSILRSEMLLSLIVELEVGKYQDTAQASMDKLHR